MTNRYTDDHQDTDRRHMATRYEAFQSQKQQNFRKHHSLLMPLLLTAAGTLDAMTTVWWSRRVQMLIMKGSYKRA